MDDQKRMTQQEREDFRRSLERIEEEVRASGIKPLDTGGFSPFEFFAPGTPLGDLLIWGSNELDLAKLKVSETVN